LLHCRYSFVASLLTLANEQFEGIRVQSATLAHRNHSGSAFDGVAERKEGRHTSSMLIARIREQVARILFNIFFILVGRDGS
jgi:hypothetical protein